MSNFVSKVCFDQPRHRLILFPAVAQSSAESIPKAEQPPSTLLRENYLPLHQSPSALPAPKSALEICSFTPWPSSPIFSIPKGKSSPASVHTAPGRILMPTLSTPLCECDLLIRRPQPSLPALVPLLRGGVAQCPTLSVPKGEELSGISPCCCLTITCRSRQPPPCPLAPRPTSES